MSEELAIFPNEEEEALPNVERLRDGDPESWRQAFNILFPLLHRVARRKGLSDADARDVAQATLAEISNPDFLAKCAAFDDLMNLSRAVALRRTIDWLRKEGSKKRGGGKVTSWDALLEEGKNAWVEKLLAGDLRDQLDLAELLKLLLKVAHEDLNDKERDFLSDRYTLGFTLKEISENRQVPEGSVGATIGRALQKIRDGLSRRGWNWGKEGFGSS